MPRPAKLPEWASSGANVLEPSSGKKIAGWLPNEQPPASFFNWLFATLYQWVQWLSGAREAQELTALLSNVSTTTGGANAMYAYALNDSGLLVAVGLSGKIYTSVNFGGTWTAQTAAASYTGSFTDVLWTGTKFIAVGSSGMIQISSNGTSWAVPTTNTAVNNLNSVARSSALGAIVAVGSNGFVTRSTDDGANWTAQGQIVGTGFSIFRIVESGGVFVLCANNGVSNLANEIWRSVNGGVTFFAVDLTGVLTTGAIVGDVAVLPGGGGFVAAAGLPTLASQIIVNSDGTATTWVSAYTTPTNYNVFLCSGAAVIALVPQLAQSLVGYVSADRGTTWRAQAMRLPLADSTGAEMVEGGNVRAFVQGGKTGDAGKVAISQLWAAF